MEGCEGQGVLGVEGLGLLGVCLCCDGFGVCVGDGDEGGVVGNFEQGYFVICVCGDEFCGDVGVVYFGVEVEVEDFVIGEVVYIGVDCDGFVELGVGCQQCEVFGQEGCGVGEVGVVYLVQWLIEGFVWEVGFGGDYCEFEVMVLQQCVQGWFFGD